MNPVWMGAVAHRTEGVFAQKYSSNSAYSRRQSGSNSIAVASHASSRDSCICRRTNQYTGFHHATSVAPSSSQATQWSLRRTCASSCKMTASKSWPGASSALRLGQIRIGFPRHAMEGLSTISEMRTSIGVTPILRLNRRTTSANSNGAGTPMAITRRCTRTCRARRQATIAVPSSHAAASHSRNDTTSNAARLLDARCVGGSLRGRQQEPAWVRRRRQIWSHSQEGRPDHPSRRPQAARSPRCTRARTHDGRHGLRQVTACAVCHEMTIRSHNSGSRNGPVTEGRQDQLDQ